MKMFAIALTFGLGVAVTFAGPVGKAEDDGGEVYTFAFGKEYKPYEMITEDGDLMGFSVDIVRRVCEMAGKNCAFISYYNYSMCWNSRTMYGEALNGRYWDACVGYTQTNERMLVYGFLGEYAQENAAYLYTRRSSNVQQYDSQSQSTGFVTASRLSPKCIKRSLGETVSNPRYYDNDAGLLNALTVGQIEVAFAREKSVQSTTGNFRRVSERIGCAERGFSLMMRKDVVDRYQWFDETLEKLKQSEYYRYLCALAKKAYDGDPGCFEESGN